ncbi:MAG: HAD-superfamily hydrolase, subfamily IA, variant 3 [uncultured bacterium]|nr:MAG: HAD-superfamily hydrolase, subfamily IA, variant 3 [uncultured bacterium]KKU26152.1 MAG: Hydrolase, CbbY/CbbZ/GpH/YieH family [Microgenomates group bacterium GW2011_GWA2_46_16]
MPKISFVYFDVGGVMIQDFSDSPKWDQMMVDMGLDKFDRIKIDAIYDRLEDGVAIGKRHIDTLISIYEKEFGVVFEPNFSMQKYFVDHFDKNVDLWPIVADIHKTLKVGLLTDMYPGLLDAITVAGLLPPVIWDQIIDSTKVGIRKPTPEIYKIAAKQAGVPEAEILFIDNREKNLVPAHARGWQTFFYDSHDYAQSSRDLVVYLQPRGL